MRYIFILLLIAMALIDCKKRHKKKLRFHDHNSKSSDYYHMSADHTLSDFIGDSKSDDNGTIFDLKSRLARKFVFQAAKLRPSKSLVCSPLSALLPLGKLAFGAKDKTLKELLKAIGVSSIEQVESRFVKYFNDLKNLEGVTLSIASRIYLNKDMKLHSEFKAKTEEIFKSSVELVDVKDPLVVAETVNLWVKQQTNGMISKLLSPNDIVPDMTLLLVNAVHFKGQWKYPFTEENSDTFHCLEGDKLMPMMEVTNQFKYHKSATLNAKVIQIPYKGSNVKFIIVLPNSRTGLTLLINQLSLAPTLLNKIRMRYTRITLTVPKFTIESEIDLTVLYKKTGLQEIFNALTGLHIMVRGTPVKVDMARQKAIIEVTREGTEAAAASAVVIGLGDAPATEFKANHPFLYFIVAEQQQLFAGIFTGG